MRSRLGTLLGSDIQSKRVTILYEDLSAVLKANALLGGSEVMDKLEANAKTEFWRFDFLTESSQRKAATKMATRSDLVVVSARSLGHIWPEVESCIHSWLQGRRRRPARFAV